jgi:hypothetical protein
MTKQRIDAIYHDYFEYHGNTTIEFIRKRSYVTIEHKWFVFDSAQEALDYFNTNCEA